MTINLGFKLALFKLTSSYLADLLNYSRRSGTIDYLVVINSRLLTLPS